MGRHCNFRKKKDCPFDPFFLNNPFDPLKRLHSFVPEIIYLFSDPKKKITKYPSPVPDLRLGFGGSLTQQHLQQKRAWQHLIQPRSQRGNGRPFSLLSSFVSFARKEQSNYRQLSLFFSHSFGEYICFYPHIDLNF